MNLRTKEYILNAVCETFGIIPEQIQETKSRSLALIIPRMAYAYILNMKLNISHKDIADLVGRDRSVVYRMLDQHYITYKTNAGYKDKIDIILGTGAKQRKECILVVNDTYPNKKSGRGYDGAQRKNRALKKMFNHMVAEGFITLDIGITPNYEQIYSAKLNVPTQWLQKD